jgi:hypothetical protein
VIQQILPEPQASLLSGILLGGRCWAARRGTGRSPRDRHHTHHRDIRVNIKPNRASPFRSLALSWPWQCHEVTLRESRKRRPERVD